MKILFICKYNRFRSRIAEAIFNKLNKNKKYKVKSAGIIRGNPLDKNQLNIAKKLELNIKGNPKGLASSLLKWQDITVIVADNVPPEIINNKKHGKKLIVWKIPDAKTNSRKEIEEIINKIKNKVIKFLGELK